MSATLDVAKFSAFFGGTKVVAIPVRLCPPGVCAVRSGRSRPSGQRALFPVTVAWPCHVQRLCSGADSCHQSLPAGQSPAGCTRTPQAVGVTGGSAQGRQHAVQVLYLHAPEDSHLEAAILAVLQIHAEQAPGHLLVFLTGQEEIESVRRQLITRCGPQISMHFSSTSQAPGPGL